MIFNFDSQIVFLSSSFSLQVLVLGVVPPKGSLDLGQLRDIAGGDRNLVIAEGGFAGLSGEFGLKLSRTICGEPCK